MAIRLLAVDLLEEAQGPTQAQVHREQCSLLLVLQPIEDLARRASGTAEDKFVLPLIFDDTGGAARRRYAVVCRIAANHTQLRVSEGANAMRPWKSVVLVRGLKIPKHAAALHNTRALAVRDGNGAAGNNNLTPGS